MEKRRVAYADALRIIATFGVILIHAAANVMTSCRAGADPWMLANVISAVVRFSVPVFFMISGIFFLNPEKEIAPKKLWKKNVLRLFVALVFWGFAYELYPMFFVKHETGVFPWEEVMPALGRVITADGHFHLYFIYLMLGIYIVTPILRVFTRQATRRQLEYFILLWFILSGVVPTVTALLPIPGLDNWARQMQISLPLGYVGYFISGYYLNKYELKKPTKSCIMALGLIALILAAAGTVYLSTVDEALTNAFLYEGLSPLVMLYSWAVFLFIKNRKCVQSLSDKKSKCLGTVAECTFGIYLIHDFANMAIKDLGISFVEYLPVVSLPVYSLTVFLVCFVIVLILRKIPGVNKYLI